MSSYPTSSLRRFQLLLTGRPSISFLDQSEYRNDKIMQRNTHNLSMTHILDDALLEATTALLLLLLICSETNTKDNRPRQMGGC